MKGRKIVNYPCTVANNTSAVYTTRCLCHGYMYFVDPIFCYSEGPVVVYICEKTALCQSRLWWQVAKRAQLLVVTGNYKEYRRTWLWQVHMLIGKRAALRRLSSILHFELSFTMVGRLACSWCTIIWHVVAHDGYR